MKKNRKKTEKEVGLLAKVFKESFAEMKDFLNKGSVFLSRPEGK